MGWKESPLHQFRVGDELFGMPSADSGKLKDSRWIDAPGPAVAEDEDVLLRSYELGARWMHLVRIEGLRTGDPANQRPLCLAGAGACPPAECGGPDAYVDDSRRRPGFGRARAPIPTRSISIRSTRTSPR